MSDHNRKPPSKTDRKPKKVKKISPDYLRNAGLYYLGKYAASTYQFKQVMTRKIMKSCRVHEEQVFEDCTALLDDVITDFERSGLLNDALYAEGIIKAMRSSGKSKKAIAVKLAQKGIDKALGEDKLLEYNDKKEISAEDIEMEAALIFARKKRLGPFKTDKTKDIPPEKQLASFARAGFSYAIAKKIL